MQFKHPELLYALLLLVIPVLIHLFQLRRFQKVKFTNVKLLKQIDLQTRKSSQLKKWLVLLTRLFIIACAVLAFAQPFIPNTLNYNDNQETVIYLDNSFSMQAKGANGTLLNEAIQNILNSIPDNEKLSIYTNDKVFQNTTLKAIKNDLISLNYSNFQLNYQEAYLKGKQLFSNDINPSKNLVLVSDFQQKSEAINIPNDSLVNLTLVKQKPNITSNISIDSVYIKARNVETLDIAAVIKSYGSTNGEIPVSLYDSDKLLTKTAAIFEDNTSSEVIFSVQNSSAINGKITIEDNGLNYDNTFFFNLNETPKIKVLSIYNENKGSFLERIYTTDEFEYLKFRINELNFNIIPKQNLIILNELDDVSDALVSALSAFTKDGGSVVVVPSDNIDLTSYNLLLKALGLSIYLEQNTSAKRVTKIHFDHPLLSNTFYTEVSNFQYPKTELNYTTQNRNRSVLNYEDEASFLFGNNGLYAFTSPLNSENSNFINSQLIVPIFYNIGLQSLPLAKLFYTIGNKNDIAINTELDQDEILTLEDNNTSVIPLQNTYSNSVVIQTEDFPIASGILTVKSKKESIQNLSFNYPRKESQLSYLRLDNIDNFTVEDSLKEAITSIKSNTNVNALWKWFVIFALLFLLTEMVLLKYLK